MNATWHSAIKTTPYELVFGRKFNWRNHLDDHQRIAYTPEDEATPLEEIYEQRYHTSLAAENLQSPSCEFTFCAPDQIESTELSPLPPQATTPMRPLTSTPGSTMDSSSYGPISLTPRRCSNLATLPLNQSQLQYLPIDPQLSQHQQFPTENPPAPIFFPPIIVSPENATELNSTQFPKPGPPI